MRRTLLPLFLLAVTIAACVRPRTHEGFVLTRDGVRLHYRVLGSGADTIIALHGGPGLHAGYLVGALAPLARSHTVIWYDQRGRGRSSAPLDTASLTAALDVADLEALRRHFRLERMALVGHGWGAGLAALYALEHADRVERIAMVSPLFVRATHAWGLQAFRYEGADSLGLDGLAAARLAGLDTRDPRAFCRRFWGAYLSPATVRDRFTLRRLAPAMCDAPPPALARVEPINRAVLRTLGPWDWRERLGRVAVPVLVLQGRGLDGRSDSTGSIVWRVAAREWVTSLADARAVFVNGPAQFPWLGDDRAFHGALRAFLTGAWPRDAVVSASR